MAEADPSLPAGWPWRLAALLAELAVYGLLIYWTSRYFGLTINWEKRLLESKTGISLGGGERQVGSLRCWGSLAVPELQWGDLFPRFGL